MTRAAHSARLPQLEDAGALSARSERAIEDADPLVQVQRLLQERAERRHQLPSMEIPGRRGSNPTARRSPRLYTDVGGRQVSPRTSGFTRGERLDPVPRRGSGPAHRQLRSGAPQPLQQPHRGPLKPSAAGPSPPKQPSPPQKSMPYRASSFRYERFVSQAKADIDEQRPASASTLEPSPTLYVRARQHAMRPSSAAAYVNETYPHDLPLKKAQSFSLARNGNGAAGEAAHRGLTGKAHTWSQLPVQIMEEGAAPSEDGTSKPAAYWKLVRDYRQELVAVSKLMTIDELRLLSDSEAASSDTARTKTGIDQLSAAETADRRPTIVRALLKDRSAGFADTVLQMLHFKRLGSEGNGGTSAIFSQALERTKQEPTRLRSPNPPSAAPKAVQPPATLMASDSQAQPTSTIDAATPSASEPTTTSTTASSSPSSPASSYPAPPPVTGIVVAQQQVLWGGDEEEEDSGDVSPLDTVDLYDTSGGSRKTAKAKPKKAAAPRPSPVTTTTTNAEEGTVKQVTAGEWSLADEEAEAPNTLLDLY